MRGEFVALDLETTGLDAKNDAIIEFGAVRFQDGIITGEYTTLINPGRPLPPEITTLTGITDRDFLAKPHSVNEPPQPAAPYLTQVLPAIQNFVGNSPVIGHNIGFDLGFLYPHGLFQNNLWIDTYDLAAILVPTASRYTLSSLSKLLNIELTDAHRALHDARASALLYWEMWKQIHLLPRNLIHEIVSLSQGLDWNARIIFEYALESQDHALDSQKFSEPVQEAQVIYRELKSELVTKPIDPNNLELILEHKGALDKHIEGYEHRLGQSEMAKNIAEAFNESEHLMIEAGTGIGKSIAYLIPAIEWAVQNGQRVVVSTNTLTLQDQLLSNDIPLLQKVMPNKFSATVLKGRANYLCLERLSEMRRRRPATLDEIRVLAKILVWLTNGGTGEKSDLNIRGFNEQTIWQRLSAEAENCTTSHCHLTNGGKCPFYQAQKAAEAAHIVVVNHALLLADAISENRVIPDYQYIVIDEAHHLEDAASNSLSARLEETAAKYHINHIAGRNHSTLSELKSIIQTHIPISEGKRLSDFINDLQGAAVALDTHLNTFFNAFRTFVQRGDAEGAIIIRVTNDIRRKAEFESIRQLGAIVNDFATAIQESFERLQTAIPRLKKYNVPELDNLGISLHAATKYFAFLQQLITNIIDNSGNSTIGWIHLNQSNAVSLNTAPLHVNVMLEKYIWSKVRSAILTSATLQTSNGFEYMQKNIGATSFRTLAIASPFNYRESTLIFVPNDMPDPNERGRYQQAVERALIELTAALGGKTLALFTSYSQLQQTAQAIRPRLALGDIVVYDQLDTSNRQTLLDSFKTTDKAILLGTKSFWEGIDIPGAALSALVLTKLPFPIPTDPIISARSETFGDAFNDYTIPETILRFKQGFGRLIRKQTDRGIVVLLDKRIMSKSYGQSFIDALPDCTIQYGTLQTLPSAAQKWLKINE